MADIFGTPQNDWVFVPFDTEIDPWDELSPVGHYALRLWTGAVFSWTSVPAPANDGEVLQAVIPLQGTPNAVLLMIPGLGGNLKQAQARIWLIRKTDTDDTSVFYYVGSCAGTLHLTLGQASAAGLGTGTTFVDTIEVHEDGSPTPPGMRVFGDIKDAVAQIVIDTIGCVAVVVELTCIKFDEEEDPMTNIALFWTTI